MNLFNLFAKLFLDKSEYEKGLKDSEKSASSFSSKAKIAFKGVATAVTAVTAVVTACAGALYKLSTAAINVTGAIDDNAKQLQITTTQYQEWDWIMKQIGADSSTLSMSFRQLATFTGNLADGNADAIFTMQKLGLSVKDFLNLDLEAQLNKMIRAFQGMEQGIEKTTMAQEVFGSRAYQMLLPILNDSVGSVDDLKKQIHDLGLVISEEAVSAGEKLGDKFEFMKGTVKQLAYNFGAELFPAVEKIVDGITELSTGADDTQKAIDNLINGISEIIDKVINLAPQLIEYGGQILVMLVQGILAKLPDMVPELLSAVETILLLVIEELPDIIASASDIITALVDGLLQLDWGKLVSELSDTIMKIGFEILPNLVVGLIDELIKLFTTGDGLAQLGRLGLGIVEAIANSFIMGFEQMLNLIINSINKFTKGISKIWTWMGIPAIPEIGEVTLPRVSLMKNGGMFEDLMKGTGTAYAVVGEGGAEIVAQGSKGTGVTNVEQFTEAMYRALQRFFVNGNVIVRIGDKDFKGYVLQTVNSGLKQQGRQTLNQVTRW